MPNTTEPTARTENRRPMRGRHARIVIAVVLFAAIAGLAVVLMPGTDTPKQPTAEPQLSEVQGALDESLGAAARDVEVALRDRTVILRGVVASEEQRQDALESVLALDSVVEVDDQLTVASVATQ